MDLQTQRLMMAAAGAAGDPTYVDDIFSTYLWEGTGSARSINTGVDMTEGGLTWIRRRNQATDHYLYDTASGATKYLASNDNMAQQTDTATLTAFNNNGFSLGTNGGVNGNGNDFVGWSFRKAPGFFDVVTYTGTGSARTVAHSLGCVPGMVIIKKTSGAENWNVWHKSLPLRDGYDYTRQKLELNTGTPAANLGGNTTWNDTKPSATTITLGTNSEVNENNATYVAYFFAGGESINATARSVDFQSENIASTLTIPDSSDLNVSTGNFTIEGWFYVRAENKAFFSTGGTQTVSDQAAVYMYDDEYSIRLTMRDSSGNLVQNATNIGATPRGQWFHLAISRDSNTYRTFINGIQTHTFTSSATLNDPNYTFNIGSFNNGSQNHFQGKISNFRLVKGTAVYTSSFKVPTEPLTNITNTKLLCCNNASASGSTVTPATITAVGDAVADTDSPFDDPSDAVFGENEDQRVIKCGSYTGNGNDDGPEINLGWEPQWILFRNIEENGDEWVMYDSMRGIVTEGNDARLYANASSAESSVDQVDLTPTGFKITTSHSQVNRVNNQLIYVAIRRPDGYVGKPAELGTDVFAMDAGNGNTTQAFDSAFPVDFALEREIAATCNWEVGGRLMQGKYLQTNSTQAESAASYFTFDSNTGWLSGAAAYNSGYQSWMWKRHAGFDVVAVNNLRLNATIAHSLGRTPEMIWAKNRNNTFVWGVYHKGVNGGTNPEQYRLRLQTNDAQQQVSEAWFDTAPTATHFTVGLNHTGSNGGADYRPIFMLFASVEGISKVGYYTGNGSSGHAITVGFQPRFLIVKAATTTSDWSVFDTTRGWASGNDKQLALNSDAAQVTSNDYADPTSTGFTINITGNAMNGSGETYTYYAHS